MNRQPRLTKKERKALAPARPAQQHQHAHLHCVACGVHLELEQLDGPVPSAQILTCDHGGQYLACTPCVAEAQALIDEHERTGEPVRVKAAWH